MGNWALARLLMNDLPIIDVRDTFVYYSTYLVLPSFYHAFVICHSPPGRQRSLRLHQRCLVAGTHPPLRSISWRLG